MCLNILAKKHDKYLSMAYNICKDYDYSKDVVQDAYLKIYEAEQNNPNIEIKDVYVWVVILNIIKDDSKKSKIKIGDSFVPKEISLEEAVNIAVANNDFEIDDKDMMYLERAKRFRYLDRGLLIQTYDKGLRKIEKEIGVNYGFIHRTLETTRKLILRDKYDKLYKNKRLKWKKTK